MPTLDKRLLAWSDSDDREDDVGGTATPPDHARYDRCGAVAFVDDVLVPGSEGHGGARARPAYRTRKACCAAAAGLVAVGCLCAYLSWRCHTSKH